MPQPTPAFDRGDRTYHVSNERLRAFAQLTVAQRLQWVEQCSQSQNPPPYEKLVGDLTGAYSRRINIQHRLVYQVLEEEHTVKVLRMWSHYE